MKVIKMFFILQFIVNNSFCQVNAWIDNFSGLGNNYIFDVATDSEGNIYSTGRDKGINTYGHQPLEVTPQVVGDRDIFITKHDNCGNLIWVKRLGSITSDYGYGIDVFKDTIIVTGYFTGVAYFGGLDSITATTGENNLTTWGGGADVFIAKYTSNGDLIWVKSFGGASSQIAQRVDHDKFGNIYVFGEFHDSLQIEGEKIFSQSTITGNSRTQFFLLKLDCNGKFIWINQSYNENSVTARGISVNDFGIYIIGDFQLTLTLDSVSFIRPKKRDVYFAKFNFDGEAIWAKNIEGKYFELSGDIEANQKDEIYVSGMFADTLVFDGIEIVGKAIVNSTSEAGTAQDVFIFKLDSLGKAIWGRSLGGTKQEFVAESTLDKMENLLLTGYFGGVANFDTVSILASDSLDLFYCKIDPNGELKTLQSFGGPHIQRGSVISVDNNNNTIIGGYYKDSITINSNFIIPSSHSKIFYDSFVSKMFSPDSQIKISKKELCAGDLLEFEFNEFNCFPNVNWVFEGGEPNSSNLPIEQVSFLEAGIYEIILTIPNRNNTDSVTYFESIEVFELPKFELGTDSTVCDSIVLEVQEGLGDYSWSTGETTNSITLYESRNVTLNVENLNGCTFTDSIFVEIVPCTTITQSMIYSKITIFPTIFTASSEVVHVSSGLDLNMDKTKIINTQGVIFNPIETFEKSIVLPKLETGMYFISFYSAAGYSIKKKILVI